MAAGGPLFVFGFVFCLGIPVGQKLRFGREGWVFDSDGGISFPSKQSRDFKVHFISCLVSTWIGIAMRPHSRLGSWWIVLGALVDIDMFVFLT